MLTIHTAFENSLKNYVLRHVDDLKGFQKKCRGQIVQMYEDHVWRVIRVCYANGQCIYELVRLGGLEIRGSTSNHTF